MLPGMATADVLVLVHGYLGGANSWESSGVSATLTRNGWQRAGVVTPRGLVPAGKVTSVNKFYTVELPSMAPVVVQADLLRHQLNAIGAQHPEEPLVLVGHSAGGVVARMLLVRNGAPRVKALVTIASPHLGTTRAIEALQATDDSFPFSLVKRAVAGEIYDVVRDSRGVLVDLTPVAPGNMLYWLNGQSHPDISYVSIVRTGAVGAGDELVPAFSQNMNNVGALKGKATVHKMALSHVLQPADGAKLVEILQSL
jgi:pimeloyl-ACP methyl ester carboxylesterase